MTLSRSSLHSALVLLAVAATALIFPAAHADGLQEGSKLLKQGQTKQALEQVDGYLTTHPKDASGRFLRGVILTELNRTGEAIAIFTKLTEDYPDLPEPYNNLAVIYAQQKQYDKAKSALESAIRTHPSYATAHENLGDIYARMASQAYDKALQLDSSNKTAQTKLSMIRDLMTVSVRGSGTPTTPPATTVIASAKPLAPEPTPAPAKPVAATTSPVVVAAAEPAKPAAAKPVEPAKPAPEPKPEPKPEPAAVASASDEVAKALASWAEAWSRKDAKAYLGFYASDFKTPGGEPRAAWAAERTRRVTKPGKINVAIENARVTAEGSNVVVRFRQHYKSASLSTSANKTLLMTKQNGQWKILQERIGG